MEKTFIKTIEFDCLFCKKSILVEFEYTLKDCTEDLDSWDSLELHCSGCGNSFFEEFKLKHVLALAFNI